MSIKKIILALSLTMIPALLAGQSATQGGLDPASLLKPLAESWPTYSGDYTGRRYSALKQIDTSNVKNLTLAWVARLSPGSAGTGGGGNGFGRGGGGFGGAPTIWGGEGAGDLRFAA